MIGELKKYILSAKEVKPFSFDVFLLFRAVVQEKMEQVFTIVLVSFPILRFWRQLPWKRSQVLSVMKMSYF